jgi:hypothetical protein
MLSLRRDVKRREEDGMTDPNQSAAAEKKGLPTIAWIGIGCGGVLLVVVIVVVLAGVFVARKVSDVAADFEENPVRAVATMVDKLNPDIEVVEVDEDGGTITLRDVKSGETMTVNWQDAKEGRITFSSGDKEMTLSADEETGHVNITAGEGDERTFSLTTGDGGTVEIPEWVPRYPGVEATGGASMEGPDGMSGGYTVEPAASVDEVVSFYRTALKEAGFELNVSTFANEGGAEGAILNGVVDARTCTVHIAREGGKTTVAVSYSEETKP